MLLPGPLPVLGREIVSWPFIYPCKLHLAKWHLMSPVLIFVSVLQFMLALKEKKKEKEKCFVLSGSTLLVSFSWGAPQHSMGPMQGAGAGAGRAWD